MPEVLGMADTIVVMQEGRFKNIYGCRECYPRANSEAAMGSSPDNTSWRG